MDRCMIKKQFLLAILFLFLPIFRLIGMDSPDINLKEEYSRYEKICLEMGMGPQQANIEATYLTARSFFLKMGMPSQQANIEATSLRQKKIYRTIETLPEKIKEQIVFSMKMQSFFSNLSELRNEASQRIPAILKPTTPVTPRETAYSLKGQPYQPFLRHPRLFDNKPSVNTRKQFEKWFDENMERIHPTTYELNQDLMYLVHLDWTFN